MPYLGTDFNRETGQACLAQCRSVRESASVIPWGAVTTLINAAFPDLQPVLRLDLSVWHIGHLDVPIEQWAERGATLVGMVGGVYQAHGAVKVTRDIH